MTKAAAFRATYSDFKLIKTRSVVSISFEIPLEEVDTAYQVLGGMPSPGAEVWCGIARLSGAASGDVQAGNEGSIPSRSTIDKPATPRKPVAADKRMAQRAGILCADPVFQQFLLERGSVQSKNEPEAAEFIRQYCGIASRAELIPGEPPATVWTHLHSEFEAWRLA